MTANHTILTDLPRDTIDAFDYAREECEAMGMEILFPIVGYPDERNEIREVVNEALRAWREAKGGELPPGLEPLAPVTENEIRPDLHKQMAEDLGVEPITADEAQEREREAREREEQAAEEEAPVILPPKGLFAKVPVGNENPDVADPVDLASYMKPQDDEDDSDEQTELPIS